MFIDTHCHLTKRFFPDPEPVIRRAKEAGVEKLICVGTTLEDSREAIAIAQKYEDVFAAVGIHPEEPCNNWSKFEELARNKKVVAIGETGLDNKVGLPNQKEVFLKQIEIAKKLDLPLIIHVRDAWEEIKKIDLSKNRGVFHCYSGLAEFPPNFCVSFAGNVTFKNAPELQELAKLVPLDRLLLETDSPLLAPHPLRGSQNEPANVRIIASKLAELKNVSLEEIAVITTENSNKLFKL